MIPLQIKLRNFLSYGAHVQTIDFEPFHLICLSGKNGHGKSALLDAITWALWGQARKTSATAKADEGLMRLGQTHMSVVFDFMCGGKKYRVQREFVMSSNKAHTELHFGVLNEANVCTSLSEKTSRATQQKIIDTLGLDYESCINSIFLRQGQSNEFSNKSAKERKEILATILGINRYEAIRLKALERAREKTAAHEQLTFMTNHLKEAVAQKPTLLAALATTDDEIRTLTEEEKKISKRIQEHAQVEKALFEKAHQAELLTQHLKNNHELFEQKRIVLHQTRAQLRTLRKQEKMLEQLMSESEKKKLLHEHEQLEITRTKLFTNKEQLLAAQMKQGTLTQTLTVAYHEQLAHHAQTAQKTQLDLDAVKKQYDLLKRSVDEKKKALAKLETELAAYKHSPEQLRDIIQQEEKNIERKKQFYHAFVARGNTSAATLKELEHKRTLSDSIETPACPLCEQALSSSRKRFLQEKIAQQEHLITHQKNRLARIIPLLKNQLVEQHAGFVAQQKNLVILQQLITQKNTTTTEFNNLQEQNTTLEKELQKHEKLLHDAIKIHTQFQQEKEKFFAEHDEYKEITATLAELQKSIDTLTYNPQRHEQVQQLLALLQKNEFSTQSNNRADYEYHKKEFLNCIAELKKIKEQIKKTTAELAGYAQLPEQQELHEKAGRELTEQRTKNSMHTTALMQKKGGLEQQIKTVCEREQELAQYTTKIKEYETESEDYQTIAQALSKNGIQALLIESAIPELEHEANELLSKLTDNQSHIIIESVRDLKSGGFKETLDIKISDAVGTRPYELFSGGEAFRIDFALRIAISKLLARRSGTSLQTLIIDEGFGSQDEEGLARIMEALYKIQDDFAKIIIVSHLAEMKSQFPTHFFVHKHATGSQVTVFEQG